MPVGRPWEDAWQPPAPAPRRDILAEERGRPRRMWWPGNWLSGRVGVVFLVLFLVGAAGFVVWDNVNTRMGGLSGADGMDGSVVVHPESGRSLTPAENTVGERYGRPLFLGDGGLPVVRLEATDEVRELTPVEMEYTSIRPYVPVGDGDVVWGPGPRGWGVWWAEDSESLTLNSHRDFNRMWWRKKQSDELARAVSEFSAGMRLVASMEFERWERGIAGGVYRITQDLRTRYSVVSYGHWAAVPGQWRCSDELEIDLNAGVTQGCPGSSYLALLDEVWVQLGHAVFAMDRVGYLGVRMDRMNAEDLYGSGVIRSQAYLVADLIEEVDDLDVSLVRLSDESLAVELPITVRLDFR